MIVPWCVGIISWENLLPNFDPVPLQSIWFREIDPLDKPAFCLGSCQLDISTYFSFYHFTAPQPGQTFWRFRNCKFEILLFLVLHKCQRFCGFLNCLVGPCFQSINRWSPAQKAISEKSPTLHSIAINNLAALAIPQKTGKKEWKAREQKKRKKKTFSYLQQKSFVSWWVSKISDVWPSNSWKSQESEIAILQLNETRPTLWQFQSLQILRSTFPYYIKFVYLRILRLWNSERVGRTRKEITKKIREKMPSKIMS